jgi:hypothetical protein
MPYFKPIPVTDESDRTFACGRTWTVVRRCTRTLELIKALHRKSLLDREEAEAAAPKPLLPAEIDAAWDAPLVKLQSTERLVAQR